nr:PAS domain-containing protein [Kordiimonas marina]
MDHDETVFGDFAVYTGDDIAGKNAVADFFHDYWHALQKDGRLPARADINPPDLARFIDHTVLMDVVPTEDAFQLIVRLIGTFVVEHYGEISGKDIADMRNPKAIQRIYHMAGLVLETNEPQLTLTPAFAPNRKHMEGVALYLPLYDDAGTINKIMVAVDVRSLSNRTQG